MQLLEIQPGDTTLLLNQMSNATFHCTCIDCASGSDSPPYWSLENEGRVLITVDKADRVILSQRGIMFSSSSSSAIISIPDTVENNNTQIYCAAFLFGSVEFSDQPVTVTIIGEMYKIHSLLSFKSEIRHGLLFLFRSPSTS
jgi:hypothetical protein